MDKKSIGTFLPESKTIREIFDGNNYYQIPDYQRTYDWGDEQIEDLWEDTFTAYKDGDDGYFLGPVIFIKSNKGDYDVVDGQQRLTTLMILFSTLRDLYFKTDKKILNRIKSLEEEKYRLRLITQAHYQNEFENEILDRIDFPDYQLSQKEKEKKKFLNAAMIFRDRLDTVKLADVKGYSDFILDKTVMITITCSSQSFAIKLFQTLNTRGLELSNSDLIKSYLYSKLEEGKRKQFISDWEAIDTLSDNMGEDIDDLLTYYEYFILARNPKKSLYDELEAKFKKSTPNKIIHEFKTFVEHFHNIATSDDKIIYSMYYLPNQVFWKSILLTAKMEKFHSFKGLCKEIRKLYYSYWIAGYTTSKVKHISFRIIGMIKSGKKLKDIKDVIKEKMTEDNVVSRVKDYLLNENDEYYDAYHNRWLKPLLIMVEYEQTDDSKIAFIEMSRNLHVDHILPSGWNKISDWRGDWDKDNADRWLDKIGNLTLLSGNKNIKASNKTFDDKKKIYKGKGIDSLTSFIISQEVAGHRSWTPRNVKVRNKEIISQVKEILSLDF